MIHVYKDEVEYYKAAGISDDQLNVLPFGVERPAGGDDGPSPVLPKVWDAYMKANEAKVRKIVREVLSEAVTFDNNKTFTPPPNVAQRAQEAINTASSNNLTQSGTNDGSGLAKAKELAYKQIQSFDMMRRMKSYFDTNEEAYRAALASGGTVKDNGTIQAWELHGGDSGRDWVNREMGMLNQSNLDTKKNLRKAGGANVNKGMGVFDTNMMSTNNHRIHR